MSKKLDELNKELDEFMKENVVSSMKMTKQQKQQQKQQEKKQEKTTGKQQEKQPGKQQLLNNRLKSMLEKLKIYASPGKYWYNYHIHYDFWCCISGGSIFCNANGKAP